MKFRRLRLKKGPRIVLIVLVSIVSILILNKYRKTHPSGYFSTHCLDYKQKEYCRKLNDRIVDYSAAAKLRGIQVCKDQREFNKNISAGRLVKVNNCRGYIVEKMTFSYPYLTRDSRDLLDEIAERFRAKVAQKGLNGVKFYLTSMTRRTDNVKNLRRYNGNASANSPHMYGNAFDISYKRFVVRKWRLTNCDKKYLKEALAEVIWQLRNERKCWATYEKIQNCYHIVER